MAAGGCEEGGAPATGAPPPVVAPAAHAPAGSPPPAQTITVADPQQQLTPTPPVAEALKLYRRGYDFSADWFSHNIPTWVAVLKDHMGKPDLRYLEVGVFEGRSFFWMMDQVLTHETSKAVAIEPFVTDRLRKNIEVSEAKDRIRLVDGFSGVELRKEPLESYDIIYIDGSHTADDVLEDIVLSWRLLKSGGILILDDYRWDGRIETDAARGYPSELRPKIAIDSFRSNYRSFVQVLHEGYQVVLRKRPGACAATRKTACATLGPYDYDWGERKLTRDGEPIGLSEAEQVLIERVIGAKNEDALTIDLPLDLYASDALKALDARLGLKLRATRMR